MRQKRALSARLLFSCSLSLHRNLVWELMVGRRGVLSLYAFTTSPANHSVSLHARPSCTLPILRHPAHPISSCILISPCPRCLALLTSPARRTHARRARPRFQLRGSASPASLPHTCLRHLSFIHTYSADAGRAEFPHIQSLCQLSQRMKFATGVSSLRLQPTC